jgi:hypothetical protein
VTVTTHDALKPPSAVRTVIVNEPVAFAVKRPVAEIVPLLVFELDQVTLLLPAPLGTTVAKNW